MRRLDNIAEEIIRSFKTLVFQKIQQKIESLFGKTMSANMPLKYLNDRMILGL